MTGLATKFAIVPYACEHDQSGDSCLDCGYCLNGCSAGECPMTEETN